VIENLQNYFILEFLMFKNFFFGEFSPVNEESLELGWL
jgi:hypothetical protein